MKNVLLLIHDDAGQEARLQAALDLTRALRGHLTCLDVVVMPIIPGDVYGATFQAELLSDAREREAANRARIEPRLAAEDVSYDWIDVTGELGRALQDSARMADLVVVNRQLDSISADDMRQVATQVVLGSGRAVVAVPEDARGFDAAGTALVAWDGSEQAMNALQSAIPLLRLASKVSLLEVDDGSVEIPAEEAATYLSRHDIHPVIVRRPSISAPAAEVIHAEAEAEGAGYVVMGGFGHSRIAEALFGGASRDMLRESSVPAFIRH